MQRQRALVMENTSPHGQAYVKACSSSSHFMSSISTSSYAMGGGGGGKGGATRPGQSGRAHRQGLTFWPGLGDPRTAGGSRGSRGTRSIHPRRCGPSPSACTRGPAPGAHAERTAHAHTLTAAAMEDDDLYFQVGWVWDGQRGPFAGRAGVIGAGMHAVAGVVGGGGARTDGQGEGCDQRRRPACLVSFPAPTSSPNPPSSSCMASPRRRWRPSPSCPRRPCRQPPPRRRRPRSRLRPRSRVKAPAISPKALATARRRHRFSRRRRRRTSSMSCSTHPRQWAASLWRPRAATTMKTTTSTSSWTKQPSPARFPRLWRPRWRVGAPRALRRRPRRRLQHLRRCSRILAPAFPRASPCLGRPGASRLPFPRPRRPARRHQLVPRPRLGLACRPSPSTLLCRQSSHPWPALTSASACLASPG